MQCLVLDLTFFGDRQFKPGNFWPRMRDQLQSDTFLEVMNSMSCAAFLSFMPAWPTFIWVTKGLPVSLTFIVLPRGVAKKEAIMDENPPTAHSLSGQQPLRLRPLLSLTNLRSKSLSHFPLVKRSPFIIFLMDFQGFV